MLSLCRRTAAAFSSRLSSCALRSLSSSASRPLPPCSSHAMIISVVPPPTPEAAPSENSKMRFCDSPQSARPPPTNEQLGIREVWAANLEEEFRLIRQVVQYYPYIAMDTEYPGVVAKPFGHFVSHADFAYQTMIANIHLLKCIQLGLTFLDEHGQMPDDYSTWQFNFKFSLAEDMYSKESIDLLTTAGLQFKRHEREGIDPTEFAVLLMTSGVVLTDDVYWLSFHSGYDFGYLLHMLLGGPLPSKISEFFEILKIYFPKIYDLKYLMKSTKDLKGGLQEVAGQLDIERKGSQHQAGSDSMLTGETFFRMRSLFFEDHLDEELYMGFIYGLKMSDGRGAITIARVPPVYPPEGAVPAYQQGGSATSEVDAGGASGEQGQGQGQQQQQLKPAVSFDMNIMPVEHDQGYHGSPFRGGGSADDSMVSPEEA